MSVVKRCYYEVLSVSKDSEKGTIKKSYRKLAVQFHPDKNPGDPSAEDKFKELGEAYEVPHGRGQAGRLRPLRPRCF